MRKAGEDHDDGKAYQDFVRAAAARGRGTAAVPANLTAWEERLASVRQGLRRSLGRVPPVPCPLEPQILGTIPRDGYVIERLTFQSRPGVRVTANLYRPEPVAGGSPAVLCVHGHWSWARVDPHVQARCVGLAKLGYVVLSVDAFGAGERAIEPGPGTYHGALVGASLWPAGTPLLGLHVYDNRRAVDYLISRPEVDAARLAITGASGGGNQSLYAGATDERLAAVVPVCGIGTYDAYLTTACCVCEVNAGGAAYASTGDLLAMIAPRALLVISATRDAFQFSVGEAARSVAFARARFRLLDRESRIQHVAIESGHDYSQPMREAMYGWLERWLRGRGDGGPIPEPAIAIESVETLRCYRQGTPRPTTIVTIPEFARTEGLARLASLPPAADHPERWRADADRMRVTLRDQVLGGFPARSSLRMTRKASEGVSLVTIETEPGIVSRGAVREVPGAASVALILASADASGSRPEHGVVTVERTWREAGFSTIVVAAARGDGVAPAVAGVADHNAAEWGIWIGRPLLGQRAWDITRWIDTLEGRAGVVVGLGAMSLPAVIAAALDPRIAGAVATECLVSFIGTTKEPWAHVPMGWVAPNILDVGDIGQLAALVAPRPLWIMRGVEPEGPTALDTRLAEAFRSTRAIYALLGKSDHLTLGRPADPRAACWRARG